MDYIEKKAVSQQGEIFQFARSKAPTFRQECREAEERVVNATREKFVENQDKKLQKVSVEIAQRSSISEAVELHGGACLRLEDVDELEERLLSEGKSLRQITEVFKCQIRFQKRINGRKMKFGTLEFMKNSLKGCLKPASPPKKKRKL